MGIKCDSDSNGFPRINDCPECEGTGWLGGTQAAAQYEGRIGLPDFCPCCCGRGVVSWLELEVYRKKSWQENPFREYFESKEFKEQMKKDIEDYIKKNDI